MKLSKCLRCGHTWYQRTPAKPRICPTSKARSRKVKLEIEIDEAYIAELVSQEIARRIVETHGYENREARKGIR